MTAAQRFNNIVDALEAVETGCEVDSAHINELMRQEQGDHECEISINKYESGPISLKCPKNPDHTNFIPINDFTPEKLPLEYRKHFNQILTLGALTVKIIVKFVSKDRPATFLDGTPYPFFQSRGSKRMKRHGTGFISSILPPYIHKIHYGDCCPCWLCLNSEYVERESWFLQVMTATHVVYDEEEAMHTTIECFDDCSEDKSQIKRMYGLTTDNSTVKAYEDVCKLICVTHDEGLISKLRSLLSMEKIPAMPYYDNNFGLLISHPHGFSKKVTIGTVLSLTVCNEYTPTTPIKLGNETICRLPLLPWVKFDYSDKQLPPLPFLPGEDFMLPDNLVFFISENATFSRKYYDITSDWFVLPPNTKFYLDDEEIFLPESTEFNINVFYENPVSYATYEIDSCPGSSGAGLLQEGEYGMFSIYPHSSRCGPPTINKSGLRRPPLQSYTNSDFDIDLDSFSDRETSEDEN